MALSPLPSSEPWAASRSPTGKLRAHRARPSAQAGQEVRTRVGARTAGSPHQAHLRGAEGLMDRCQVSLRKTKQKTKTPSTAIVLASPVLRCTQGARGMDA